MHRESPPAGPGAETLGTSRIEAFSDGVIAVAITLLVLDLHVPEIGGTASLAARLGAQWPNYLAYAVSFMAIGIVWINHRDLPGCPGRACGGGDLCRVVPGDLVGVLRDAVPSAAAPPAGGLLTPYLTLGVCVVTGVFYLLPVHRSPIPAHQQGTDPDGE